MDICARSKKNSHSVPESFASEEQDWHEVSETVTFDLKLSTSDQINLDVSESLNQMIRILI